MAYHPPGEYTIERADLNLIALFEYWEGMDRFVAEEWPGWDEDSRMLYLIEEAIPDSDESELERWHAEGKLTPEQETHYAEVLELIARMKPYRDSLEQD